MLYVVIAEDVNNSLPLRQAVRPQHLERLQQLQSQGRLVLAGPLPAIDSPEPGPAGFTGSIIVAEFESLQEAQAWISADPFVQQGVYAHVQVKPFRQIFPTQS